MRASGHGRRIGLLGGSFDPPHLGHALMASWALCRADLDELRLVPTWAHPFAKPLTDFDERCGLVEVAMAHLAPLARLDRIEARLGGTSYTLRTVEQVLEDVPGATVVWVGGADSWARRHDWHEADRLERLVEPCVLGRQGYADPEGLEPGAHLPPISSTEARARLAGGRPVAHLVGPRVLARIRRRGLYGTAPRDHADGGPS